MHALAASRGDEGSREGSRDGGSRDSRSVVRAPSGAALEERREPDGAVVVELRAPDGELVVEYRPESGRCRIHARSVELRAEDDLRLSAGRRVEIEGAEGVELRSGQAWLGLGGDALTFAADRVRTEARQLVQRVGEIETHARRVIERARESFRDVEELAQTRAGRLRLVAEETVRILGQHAFFKARQDMKLRGSRIYLD